MSETKEPHGTYPDGTPVGLGCCVPIPANWKTYSKSVSISLEDLERQGYTLNDAGFPVPKVYPFSLRVYLRNLWAVAFLTYCLYAPRFLPFL